MGTKKRDRLIAKYTPLVREIVDRIAVKVPPHMADRDELINVGIIGLIHALEKFDKTRNVPFESYARFRIRGAVLDELRSRDWHPRSAKHKDARIEKAVFELRKRLGRQPQEEEIADYLGLSIEDYYRLLDDARGVSVLNSEDLPPDFCEKYASYDVLERIEQENPFVLLAKNETRSRLRQAIESLPEKEKTVLSLYYYEDLTMKNISPLMKITESRISQLHSRAISRLRNRAIASGLQ